MELAFCQKMLHDKSITQAHLGMVFFGVDAQPVISPCAINKTPRRGINGSREPGEVQELSRRSMRSVEVFSPSTAALWGQTVIVGFLSAAGVLCTHGWELLLAFIGSKAAKNKGDG